MNDYDDLFVDEVMRDVWARKAEVSAEYDDWKNYHTRPREITRRPDGTPWPVASLKMPQPRAGGHE
jgi:hypothetical protein